MKNMKATLSFLFAILAGVMMIPIVFVNGYFVIATFVCSLLAIILACGSFKHGVRITGIFGLIIGISGLLFSIAVVFLVVMLVEIFSAVGEGIGQGLSQGLRDALSGTIGRFGL